MNSSRRTLLAAIPAAGLAAPLHAAGSETVRELAELSQTANAALLRGDVPTYRRLITLTDDFTLMSPFGGPVSRSARLGDEGWVAIGRTFRNGTLRQELVESYAGTDLVVLVMIEHGHGEVGGLPAQDWPLRVTLAYRREGAGWRLAHRHADPLVHGITLQQSAALAAGG